MNWQMGACRLHSAAFGSSWQVGALFRISARKDLNWPENSDYNRRRSLPSP